MNTYEPKNLADIIIGSVDGDYIVREIVKGNIAFPLSGKSGFLIHGPFGTGNPPQNAWYWQPDDDAKENSKILKKIATASTCQPLAGKFNHIIIDEVDLFSPAHQRKLRNIMSSGVSIFYFTTNEHHRIDRGIRSRCHEVHFCAAEAHKWLPLFTRVLQDRGASVPSAVDMLPLIEACNGSIRDIVTAAQILAAKRIAHGHINPAAANSNDPDKDAA